MIGRYVNPFTDFGFKKIFGSEENKDILIDFLETLLPEKGKIKKLRFLKTEHLGNTQEDRKAVFDLYCENDRKEKFIVELQKAKQLYFKERSLYYATFAIQEQAVVGEWNFKINAVYTISLMDFVFDDTHKKQYIHDVQLIETKTGKVFNDKLRFIYIEMPKFSKEEKNLKTHLEKWIYVLKNLSKLEEMPPKVKERVFEKLFNSAEIANYSKKERDAYVQSQKYANDWKNVLDTTLQEGLEKGIEMGIEKGIQKGIEKGIKQGIQKGIEQGIEKGKIEALKELAQKSLEKGIDEATIAELTGLSIEEVKKIKNNQKKKS